MKITQGTLSRPETIILPLAALVILSVPARGSGQIGPDLPIQFRITGEFHDPQDDPNKGGVNRFTVNVGDKQWILDIERADVQAGGALGTGVLRRVYPPIMTFVGPEALTDRLRDPGIQGKSFTMTGQLYVKRRMFKLTHVVNNDERTEGESGKGRGKDGTAEAGAGALDR